MAVHVIAGVMGSGKSFEAVKEKILPALRNGQRVVTNIEGLDHQLIADYLSLPLADVERLLVVVRTVDFVTGESKNRGISLGFLPASDTDTSRTVHPGDLVVLDEVWDIFPKGTQLSAPVMQFFRMHRHWVSEASGLTTDIVLCIQSVRDLHPDIRNIIEVRFQCRKLKILGRPDKYQVWLFEGDSRSASHHYDRYYDPAIFPLYKSHAKGGAVESFDRRQSGFNRPLFKYAVPLAVLGIVLGSVLAYLTLHKLTSSPASATSVSASVSTPASAGSPVASPSTAASRSISPAPAAAVRSGSADDWRVVASYRTGGFPVFVLVDAGGRYRTTTPGALSIGAGGEPTVQVGDVQGATSWTSSPATYTSGSRPSGAAR